MDQSVLAGVGNVYRCEVLFRQRVDPFRPGREIRRTTWDAIWLDLVDLLPLGVATGQDRHRRGAGRGGPGRARGGRRGPPHRAQLLRLQAAGRAVPGLRVEDPHPGRRQDETCSGAGAASAAADPPARPGRLENPWRAHRLLRHHGRRRGWVSSRRGVPRSVLRVVPSVVPPSLPSRPGTHGVHDTYGVQLLERRRRSGDHRSPP